MKAVTTKVYRPGQLPKVVMNSAAKARHEATPDFRRAVIRRDKGVCRYCGVKPALIEVDHVWPVCSGGQTTFENCVAACQPCNKAKGWSTTWIPLTPQELFRLSRGIAPVGKFPAEQRKRWKKIKAVKPLTVKQQRVQAERMQERVERYGDDRVFRYTGK